MSDVSKTNELIARARGVLGRINTNTFDHDLLFQYRGAVLRRELTLIVRDLADALEAATHERDDLEGRLADYLCDSTGGLLSKTGYDVRTMTQHTEEYYDKLHAADRAEVEAERDAATAAVERVRAIHTPGKIIDVWGKSRSQADDFLVCVECTDPDNWWIAHPCATIAALDGVHGCGA